MTPTRLEELIHKLYRLPPRPEVDEDTLEMFTDALVGLSDEQIELGFKAARATCKFAPAPATIRELAGAPPIATAMTLESRADIAYREAIEARDKFHYTNSVHFEDALTAATIRAGAWEQFADQTEDARSAWEQFCSVLNSKTEWQRREFVRIYQQLAQLGITAEQGRHLVGFFEGDSISNGFQPDHPKVQPTGLAPMVGMPVLPLPKEAPRQLPQTIPAVAR